MRLQPIHRGILLTAAFLAGTAGVLPGQSPEQQDALAALSDSLHSTTTVEALERIPINWNGKVPRVMNELRKALLWLRQGEIRNDPVLFYKALDEFKWAAGSAKDWPYPWYGAALTLFGMKRRGFENREVTSKDMADYTAFYLGGERALRQSWLIDSTFEPTVDLLIDLMYAEGDRTQQKWRVRAVEARRRTVPMGDPRAEFILGRSYRMADDPEEALLAFEMAGALGGNPAIAALERSRTLPALGHEDQATEAYYDGLAQVDSAGRAFYRTDLAWITTFDELTQFDSVPDDSLPSWMSSFWERRAAEALQAPGERLREHLRRWYVANLAFRVSRPWQRAWLNPPLIQEVGACTEKGPRSIDQLEFPNPSRPRDLRSLEPMLDHRAVTYMRHGKPAYRVWWAGNPTEGDLLESYPMVIRGMLDTDIEGWVYWINGRPRVFHFTTHQALGWGTSINTAFLPPDYFRALARVEGQFNVAAAAQDLAIWNAIDRVSTAVPYRCQPRIKRVADKILEDMEVGVATESYALLFPESLDPTVQVFGLPGADENGKGTALVVFSVPLERLTLDEPLDGVPLRFRLSAVDSASSDFVWIDSTRTFLVDEGTASDGKLVGFMEMPLPEGEYRIRAAIQTPDSVAGSAVILPNTVSVWQHSDSLRVSDIVTGRPEANLAWTYRGRPVVLNPLNTYYPGGTATLFYVVDGQVPDDSYRTTITLREWDSDEDIISLTFEEAASGRREYRRRDLVLAGLRAGRYRVRLTLLDERSNRTVVKEQVLNLLD